MIYPLFYDRHQAGKLLAQELRKYRKYAVVLALARGGVVVGYEIARSLLIRLEVLVVRKLGVPWQKELGFGAIAEGGSIYIDEKEVKRLGIDEETREEIKNNEMSELTRRIVAYRQGRQLQKLTHMTAIVVDDGVATGATLFAAIQTVKTLHPKLLIAAVPVCSTDIAEKIRSQVDELVCLHEVWDMQAIGMYYENFQQVEDEEVLSLLHERQKHMHRKQKGHLVAM